MIASLAGKILEKSATHLVLDVNGVGYAVAIPSSTYFLLPEVGEHYRCAIYTAVREDAITLYGFDQLSQKSLFIALIKVNGVGPKVALGILSSVSVNDFLLMIQQRETQRLVRLPGVGKKTAERLLLDLEGYVKQVGSDVMGELPPSQGLQEHDEALEALLSLGYTKQQAQQVLQRIGKQGLSTDELIRASLKALSPA